MAELYSQNEAKEKHVCLLDYFTVGVSVSDGLYSFIFRSVKSSWATLKMDVVCSSETSVSLYTDLHRSISQKEEIFISITEITTKLA